MSKKMSRPIQIEVGEWWFMGCFIQLFTHPKLYGKYEVFKDTEAQEHIDRFRTFAEAKRACANNEVTNFKHGYKSFI